MFFVLATGVVNLIEIHLNLFSFYFKMRENAISVIKSLNITRQKKLEAIGYSIS
ncbi:hypothetical protein SBF1_1820001 [Candidatus Desulfosporosinus infrequens]|uniref:Uncharacterized protein n=1 Tax=Candidatus Desulfosporosinus infrequens TaxID=2043169 RepID=A0A2U3KCU3_9FIRM|nr:hypothetical protein SBF1_1820001 [Candidatus Desulfosporosinus infrequens]